MKKILWTCTLFTAFILHAKEIRLDVPYTRQTVSAVCGAASLDMVFRYWNVSRGTQYDIATEIARRFAEEPRFRNSNFLKNKQPDWNLYPGTPAYIMYRYSNKFGDVYNENIKRLPGSSQARKHLFEQRIREVEKFLDQKKPVIVHQYWKGPGSGTHYRVVIGYDSDKNLIYLLDPRTGPITYTYSEMQRQWSVNEKWLPFWYLVFSAR